MSKVIEGEIPYKGYKTYYKIVGEDKSGRPPLVMLHGGPGSTHFYLEPYELMAERYGRQVVFYDQIGCGLSAIPHQDDDFYSYELWMDELDVVREALGLDRIHLFGHSWGGMLAMMYALRCSDGLLSLTVAASPANINTWLLEARRLVDYLPADMQAALWKAEETGSYDDPAAQEASDEYYRRHNTWLLEARRLVDYLPADMQAALWKAEETGSYDDPAAQEASDEYYRRHVTGCARPWPECIQKSFDMTGECYGVMQGASEFVVTGKMRDFDVTGELHRLAVPTLLLSGTADEATALVMKESLDRIPTCEWALIPGGAHMGHVQYPDEYAAALEGFLARRE